MNRLLGVVHDCHGSKLETSHIGVNLTPNPQHRYHNYATKQRDGGHSPVPSLAVDPLHLELNTKASIPEEGGKCNVSYQAYYLPSSIPISVPEDSMDFATVPPALPTDSTWLWQVPYTGSTHHNQTGFSSARLELGNASTNATQGTFGRLGYLASVETLDKSTTDIETTPGPLGFGQDRATFGSSESLDTPVILPEALITASTICGSDVSRVGTAVSKTPPRILST